MDDKVKSFFKYNLEEILFSLQYVEEQYGILLDQLKIYELFDKEKAEELRKLIESSKLPELITKIQEVKNGTSNT